MIASLSLCAAKICCFRTASAAFVELLGFVGKVLPTLHFLYQGFTLELRGGFQP